MAFSNTLALGASTMHLGRPLDAWRSFVGLKTSWPSREIIVFGVFAMLALIYAGSFWLPVGAYRICPFDREWTDMKRTALLMAGVLRRATIPRFVCGALGGVMLPALVLLGVLPSVIATGILPISVLGELLERYLLFTAVCSKSCTQTIFMWR